MDAHHNLEEELSKILPILRTISLNIAGNPNYDYPGLDEYRLTDPNRVTIAELQGILFRHGVDASKAEVLHAFEQYPLKYTLDRESITDPYNDPNGRVVDYFIHLDS